MNTLWSNNIQSAEAIFSTHTLSCFSPIMVISCELNMICDLNFSIKDVYGCKHDVA